MKNNALTVPRNRQLHAKREAKTHKPVTAMPNTVWGTDMTKTRTGDGWAYVHVVIDWGTKKLLALEASLTSRTSDWIRALDKAVNLQFPDGILHDDPYGLIPSIVSDNGCQPTSKAYSDYEK